MAAPSPAPATPPPYSFEWGPSPSTTSTTAGAPAKANPDFSPPLIAMVAVIGTAFLIVLYVRILSRHLRYLRRRFRRWRRRRRLFHSTVAASSDLGSPPPPFPFPPFDPSASDHYYFLSPYGLDDTAIKTLPLSQYSKSKAKLPAATHRDCAVCLLDFEDDDSLRTLPLCGHSFHVDCIDVWLRSHATCPLCRAAVFRQEYSCSPFVPMRAARIRPSLDDLLFDPTPEAAPLPPEPEITEINGEDHGRENRDFLLKRSYSFGFERSLAADRMVTDASTSSPWRGYRQRSFWSKRWPSPFVGSSSASRAGRVFSFRSYGRGFAVKSPFLRRRGFFNLSSEPPNRFGPSSRRSRSMTSPSAIFMRPPLPGASVLGFSSSRLRCGDPEALLSPERLDRR